MRVAFLFSEKYPNYAHDFAVFSRIHPDDYSDISSQIFTGLWGYKPGLAGTKATSEAIWTDLYKLILYGHGNIHNVGPRLLTAVMKEAIYTVQFYSIKRTLAVTLNERLQDDPHYLGFTQVLPRVKAHRVIFDLCQPRYEIDGKKIYITYSGSPSDEDLGVTDDEEFADEIISWVSENRNPHISYLALASLAKRKTKARHTILSLQADPKFMAAVQDTANILVDEWEIGMERTIYALQEVAPDAVEEFIIATKVLGQPSVTSNDCAQMAVSLRRTLEKLTDAYCPTSTKEARDKPGWVKKQWGQFIEEQKKAKDFQTEQLGLEAMALDDSLVRLGALYTMGHKGVHEHVDPAIFRSTLLRMVLLAHDILVLMPGRRRVKFDPEAMYQFFDSLDHDQ